MATTGRNPEHKEFDVLNAAGRPLPSYDHHFNDTYPHPSNLKPVQIDTYDKVNGIWKCSACYMDGTTDNGGDCVCIDDCNLVRPIYNDDEPKKQTIPTYIWVIMGCLGAGLLALLIGLTTAASLQAITSQFHPRSMVDNPGESFALDQGWVIFRSVGPSQPANWVCGGASQCTANTAQPWATQANYGAWPTWIWDPVPPPQGPLFPSRMNSLRLEIGFGTLVPRPTGATGQVKVRMIVPPHWYNTKTSPWRPLYQIACSIGSSVAVSNAARATPAQFFDINVPDFLWPNGTVNQYPFDVYSTTMGISCTYTSVANPAVTGPLNFWIAVDPGNMGFFGNTFAARRPQLQTGPNTAVVNLIRISASSATFNGQVSLRTDSGPVSFADVSKSGMCPQSICTSMPTGLKDPNKLCSFFGTMGVPLAWRSVGTPAVLTVTNCAPFLTPSNGGARTTATGTSTATGETMAGLYPATTATTRSKVYQSLVDHALAGAMGLTRTSTSTGNTGATWSINEGATEGAFTGNPSAQGQSALILSFGVTARGTNAVGTAGFTAVQLQNAFNTAVTSGALTKAMYILSGQSKMKFFVGAPAAGLAAPLLKPTQGIKGSIEGLEPAGANDDGSASKTDDAGSGVNSNPEFAYAPSTDDGNAPSDDGGGSASGGSGGYQAPVSTDDGGAGGDFRRLEEEHFFDEEEGALAPLESTEIDVIGERPGMEHQQRNLKGVLVSVTPIPPRLNAPTPTPQRGFVQIMEYNFQNIPFGLQIVSRRTPIQIVFPMFLLMVMWLMVCGQLLALLPYYLRIKKVDGWGFATAPGPLIFAMTAVRNTMPGSPPIGAIIDFTTYFWCLAIIVFNMIFLGINWNLTALLRPVREKALGDREDEAKALAAKKLGKLSTDEIVALFQNTDRPEWEASLRANGTTGKSLGFVTKIEELNEIVPGCPEVKGQTKFQLLKDIAGWQKSGVDRTKLVPKPMEQKIITQVQPPMVNAPPRLNY